MKDSQYYGGSREEADNGKSGSNAMHQAMENGATIRREKRGKETVIVIIPNPEPGKAAA